MVARSAGGLPKILAGLQLLPWLQRERKERPDGPTKQLFDCDKCMLDHDEQQRRAIGCGYLPLSDDALPWRPTGRTMTSAEVDMSKPSRLKLPICAGYVCSLPEVIEASIAHALFKSGGLLQFTGGEPPSDALIASVMTLESEVDRLITAVAKEGVKK